MIRQKKDHLGQSPFGIVGRRRAKEHLRMFVGTVPKWSFYHTVVKGGIPYQDPTVEMQIRWQAYHFAGECNIRTGIFLLLCGFLLKIVKWMKVKFQSED